MISTPVPMVTITTPIATITIYKSEGYCTCVMNEAKADDTKKIYEHYKLTAALFHEHGFLSMPILADSRSAKGTTKEVRDYIKEIEKTFPITSKLAIVVDSGLSKIAGNLFFKFSKPNYPMQLFTDMTKAKLWLIGHL